MALDGVGFRGEQDEVMAPKTRKLPKGQEGCGKAMDRVTGSWVEIWTREQERDDAKWHVVMVEGEEKTEPKQNGNAWKSASKGWTVFKLSPARAEGLAVRRNQEGTCDESRAVWQRYRKEHGCWKPGPAQNEAEGMEGTPKPENSQARRQKENYHHTPKDCYFYFYFANVGRQSFICGGW
jgi:hypothetical protein